jgi:hypothetical protein
MNCFQDIKPRFLVGLVNLVHRVILCMILDCRLQIEVDTLFTERS